MSWGDLTFVEQVSLISGLLTPPSLGIAIFQLRKTRTAAEASRVAVVETARGLATYQALLLLPQLERLEAELDEAVKAAADNADDADALKVARDKAEKVLLSWRQHCSRLRGLLSAADVNAPDIDVILQESVVLAGSAKNDLVTRKKSLGRAVSGVGKSITEVNNQLGGLSAQLSSDVKKRGPQ
jgi:chromosome segregation ATPase